MALRDHSVLLVDCRLFAARPTVCWGFRMSLLLKKKHAALPFPFFNIEQVTKKIGEKTPHKIRLNYTIATMASIKS